jgi:hypothetical protein
MSPTRKIPEREPSLRKSTPAELGRPKWERGVLGEEEESQKTRAPEIPVHFLYLGREASISKDYLPRKVPI